MSQLIQLRQRLKTVITIRKTMHAMRLIAMSIHTRMKTQQMAAENYLQALNHIQSLIPTQPINGEGLDTTARCAILISASKGLCGNFNDHIHSFYATDQVKLPKQPLITVGPEAYTYAVSHQLQVIAAYTYPALRDLATLAHDIKTFLKTSEYTEVVIYAMEPKSFFIQKPHKTILSIAMPSIHTLPTGHLFEQPAQEIATQLHREQVRAKLLQLLIRSIMAEQAARFMSMFRAAQNADQVISQMKISYHKLRQAKVTNEITDLSSSMLELY